MCRGCDDADGGGDGHAPTLMSGGPMRAARCAYLLFAVSIFTDSFRVRGLTSGMSVFGAAIVALVLGIVLTHIG